MFHLEELIYNNLRHTTIGYPKFSLIGCQKSIKMVKKKSKINIFMLILPILDQFGAL